MSNRNFEYKRFLIKKYFCLVLQVSTLEKSFFDYINSFFKREEKLVKRNNGGSLYI